MSIKVMTQVWDSALEREQKFIALAYADWANDDGENIYPATDRVAWKTGYSERQVRAITKELRKDRILVYQGQSSYRTNLYRIVVDNLPKRLPYKAPKNGRPNQQLGEETAPGLEVGAEIAPTLEETRCENFQKKVQILPKVGAKTAPDPLYIHHISTTSRGEKMPAKTVAEEHKARTEQALIRGLEKHQPDVLAGIDLTGFPEDLHEIIRETCQIWGFRTPTKKSEREKWIKDAYDLKEACGEFGFEPIRLERQRVVEYMKENSGCSPYTFNDPRSIVKSVRGQAVKLRMNGNGSKPSPTESLDPTTTTKLYYLTHNRSDGKLYPGHLAWMREHGYNDEWMRAHGVRV